jgi:threonine dehydrogenase-like Zn-dependent dehydrogenase
MKKVAILGERRAGLVEVPDPQPHDDWVVVRIHAAPMCTEYKAFVAGQNWDVLGHEAVGEVAAVARPGRFQVGDRVIVWPQYSCGICSHCLAGDYVYCEDNYDFRALHGTNDGSGTMAQYILKPERLLYPIPQGMSYERASLALCALGPSFGAFRRIGLSAFDTVVIAGAGPVGLGAVVNARFVGARPIVVESVPYRVQRAREMGVKDVFDPKDAELISKIRDATGGRGADCAIDCAGAAAAERMCIDAVRRRGRVAYIGECFDPLSITVSPDLIRKGLTVVGSWHYNLNDADRVLKVIRESPLVDLLVSHVLPMSAVQEAFELSASHETAKVILKPWE